MNDKPHIPINSISNLVPLCRACHDIVHNEKIKILGKTQTSKGIKLKLSVKQV